MSKIDQSHFDEDGGALSLEDQRILDALVEAEFDPEGIENLSPSDQARAHALLSLFSLLEDYPTVEPDEALVQATLAQVLRHDASSSHQAALSSARGENDGGRRRLRIKLPDFISVAAVFLIGASILWPVVTAIRQRSIDLTCSNNLRMLGTAFRSYAQDNGGRVPVMAAGLGSSAMLLDSFPLINQGYCDKGCTHCPGHPSPNQPNYSFQVQALKSGRDVIWQQDPETVIAGDRNPIIDARRAALRLTTTLVNSSNHGERGQYVLINDISVSWLTEPLLKGGDNIWLISGSSRFVPGALPDSTKDAFLAH